MTDEPEKDMLPRIPVMCGLSNVGVGCLRFSDDEAAKDIVKLVQQMLWYLFCQSRAKTWWVGGKVAINEGESFMPGGIVVWRELPLDMFGADIKVGCHTCVMMCGLAVLLEFFLVAEYLAWTLWADVDVSELADLHIR